MSERRQLALLLAGLVALTAVGVVGASLFPEACEDLERAGDLELAFTDAADALPVAAEVGATLEGLGEVAGFGPWRGAVALPDDALVTRSEFGFFVADADDFAVLRPSLGIASVARGRAGLDVIPAGTSIALRAEDGETAVFNGEYELDRCGELPADLDVLALDRGFAVVADGPEVALVSLSGGELWRAPALQGAHVSADAVVLGQDGLVELRDVRDGEVLDRVTEVPQPAPVPWLAAAGDALLLPADSGVVPLSVATAALETGAPVDLPFAGPVTAAVVTPGGVVGLATADPADESVAAALATDRVARPADLPPGVTPVGLHASEDGHVGVVVEVDGARALLVYGPDRATDG